jgi:hypothetical protein
MTNVNMTLDDELRINWKEAGTACYEAHGHSYTVPYSRALL